MLEHRTGMHGLPLLTVAALATGLVAWAVAGFDESLVLAAGHAGEGWLGSNADLSLAARPSRSPGSGASGAPAAEPLRPRALVSSLEGEVARARHEAHAAQVSSTHPRDAASSESIGTHAQVLWVDHGVVRAEGEVGHLGPEGEWKFWHPNGRRAAQGDFEAGLPGGAWTWWDDAGRVRAAGGLDEGRPTGHWQSWYANGELGLDTRFEDGLEDGALLEFYEDGAPRSRGRHVRGQRTQRWVTWYPGGGKRSQGAYENGLRQGDWVQWHRNGALKQRAHYDRGRPQGPWNEWYPTGQVRENGRFMVGLREGWWEFFLADGAVDRRTGSYSSGRRIRN